MYAVAVISLMLAFAAVIAWASWAEWQTAWVLWRHPAILAVTERAVSDHERYLVGEMRRIVERNGGSGDDIWDAWSLVRDAFIEDEILPALDPRLIRLVADRSSTIRWKVEALIDSRVVLRWREEERSMPRSGSEA